MNEHSNLLELARQRDTNAIETILNQQLEAKNITTKVVLKDSCLQIMLGSEQVPDQQFIAVFIYKKITNLDIQYIERLKIYGKQTGDEFPAWSQEFDLSAQLQDKLIIQDPSKVLYTRTNNDSNEATKIKIRNLLKSKNLYIILGCLLSLPLTLFVIAKIQNYSQVENVSISREVQKVNDSPESSIVKEVNKLNQYVETLHLNEYEYLELLQNFKFKLQEYANLRNITPDDESTEFQKYLSSAVNAHSFALGILSNCSNNDTSYECLKFIEKAENLYVELKEENRNFEDNDISSWTKTLWDHAKQDTDRTQAILDSATSSSALYNSSSTSPPISSSSSISSSSTKKSYPLTQCGFLLTSIDSMIDTPENNRVLFQQGKYYAATQKIIADSIMVENFGKLTSQNTQLYSAWKNLILYLRVHRTYMNKLSVAQSNSEQISQDKIDEINDLIESEDKQIEIIHHYCD